MSMDEHKTKPAGSDVCPSKRKQLDLENVNAKLSEATGPDYWRSLEELAGTKSFGRCCTASFRRRVGMARRFFAARFSQNDGCVVGTCGTDRLHEDADH